MFESEQVGPGLEIFKDIRANQRIYQEVPRLQKGAVNYVVFAALDKLTFEPDVLIVTANVSQAEILLRAHSYSSGRMWTAKGTSVIGCAWLCVYCYISGELNFTLTGFGFGMRSRRLWPEVLISMSVPYDLLPGMINNLQDMKRVPHFYTVGGAEHKRKVKAMIEALKQESHAN